MEKPKIAIIGYGQMGKQIEKLAKENNFSVTDIFDLDKPIDEDKNYEFDVAIDFTFPDALEENVRKISKLKKNIVIGTTGWYDKKAAIEKYIIDNNTGAVWGSNFSIGMQMMFRIIDYASTLVNNAEDYDVFMHEIHHVRKKDSPSGTAITLAETIMKNVKRKKEMLTETAQDKIEPGQLHVSSTRGGETTGTHSVYFDSEADTIEIIHRAKNRSGFAMGALIAAEWIYNKKGFHDFSDVLNEIWEIK